MNQSKLLTFLKENIQYIQDIEPSAQIGRKLLIDAGAFSSPNELNTIESFGKAMKNLALGVLSSNPLSTTSNAAFFVEVYTYAEGLQQANDNFFSDNDRMDDMIEKSKQIMDFTRNRLKSQQETDPEYDEIHISETLLELAAYDHVYGSGHSVTFSHILSSFARLCVDHDGKVTKSEEKFLLDLNRKTSKAISSIKDILNIVATISQELHNESKADKSPKSGPPVNESNFDALKQLEQMTGINSVKSEVKSLINSAKISKIRAEKGLPETSTIEHFVFHGNPGTGKTTVARLLAAALKSIGVLQEGHLVEVDRSGLVAGYVGQTAEKTRSVAQSALGGVLFIDEAYSLAKGENDFGLEAIETILKFMEDNRGRLVVIVAGYTDRMSEFINSNPGLRSRFGRFIEFPDYSSNELFEIFEKMCINSKMKLTDDARLSAIQLFQDRCENKGPHFGNARLARNLFQDSISNQADRLIGLQNFAQTDLQILEAVDIGLRSRVEF